MSQNAENLLVGSLKDGREDAFELLYDNYSGLIYGIIYKIVGDKEDANNLLQDCFVKVWRYIASYDESKGRLSTWLINIARNTAIDFKRSKYFFQRQQNQDVYTLVSIPMVNPSGVDPLDTLDLRKLVDTLTPASKQVIEWMYFEGYTQQEISERFEIPLGTVKTRTRLALKELRQLFQLERG